MRVHLNEIVSSNSLFFQLKRQNVAAIYIMACVSLFFYFFVMLLYLKKKTLLLP